MSDRDDAEPAGAGDAVRALSFVVDGTRYCLALGRVANVLAVGSATDPTATPLSASDAEDPHVAGTLEVADRVVRVLDVVELFGGESPLERRPDGLAVASGSVLVFGTRTGTHVDGWLVEAVEGTATFEREAVEPVAGTARYVKGSVALDDGDPAIWLDPVSINN